MVLTGKDQDKNDENINKEELEVSQVAENLQRLMRNSTYIQREDDPIFLSKIDR